MRQPTSLLITELSVLLILKRLRTIAGLCCRLLTQSGFVREPLKPLLSERWDCRGCLRLRGNTTRWCTDSPTWTVATVVNALEHLDQCAVNLEHLTAHRLDANTHICWHRVSDVFQKKRFVVWGKPSSLLFCISLTWFVSFKKSHGYHPPSASSYNVAKATISINQLSQAVVRFVSPQEKSHF